MRVSQPSPLSAHLRNLAAAQRCPALVAQGAAGAQAADPLFPNIVGRDLAGAKGEAPLASHVAPKGVGGRVAGAGLVGKQGGLGGGLGVGHQRRQPGQHGRVAGPAAEAADLNCHLHGLHGCRLACRAQRREQGNELIKERGSQEGDQAAAAAGADDEQRREPARDLWASACPMASHTCMAIDMRSREALWGGREPQPLLVSLFSGPGALHEPTRLSRHRAAPLRSWALAGHPPQPLCLSVFEALLLLAVQQAASGCQFE